jgi:hypothetical protein
MYPSVDNYEQFVYSTLFMKATGVWLVGTTILHPMFYPHNENSLQ